MKRINTLLKLLHLSEYVKLAAKSNYKKHHHPLKNEMSKSSKRILILLRNGDLNQRAISKKLMISPQAVSETIKKLEIEEYIIKDTSKKETIIKLSEKGKIEAISFLKVIQSHADEFLKDFSDEELDLLIKLINKLTKEDYND